MPELPEVETITSDLRGAVLGRTVFAVYERDPDTATVLGWPSLGDVLAGARIVGARRRAKHLLIDLVRGEAGEPVLLAFHLLVYGQLLLLPASAELLSDERLAIELDDGSSLRLNDESGYARAVVGEPTSVAEALGLGKLGPEPLGPDFDVETLAGFLRGRRAKLKPLLLDQHNVSGLGNIYVDEALFVARLHPERAAGSMEESETRTLFAAIQDVLRAGIEDRGTTFDSYRDLHGQPGGHQKHLSVFQRTGKPCPRCGTKIAKSMVGGRATYICAACQPKPG